MKHLAFEREYNHAVDLTSPREFSHILSQHAVIMVDLARPEIVGGSKLVYMNLGVKLARVQENWTRALCLKEGDENDLTKQYRVVVNKVIVDFTNGLIVQLSSSAGSNSPALTGGGIATVRLPDVGDFHARFISARSEENLKQARILFYTYVSLLQATFHHSERNSANFYDSARDALIAARTLGRWLDSTIFSK